MKKSFSLIEMVVVMSIMTVLLVSLFSSYLGALSVYQQMGNQRYVHGALDRVSYNIASELNQFILLDGLSRDFEAHSNKIAFTSFVYEYKENDSIKLRRICYLRYSLSQRKLIREIALADKSLIKAPSFTKQILLEDIETFNLRYGFWDNDSSTIRWRRSVGATAEMAQIPDYVELNFQTYVKNKLYTKTSRFPIRKVIK